MDFLVQDTLSYFSDFFYYSFVKYNVHDNEKLYMATIMEQHYNLHLVVFGF